MILSAQAPAKVNLYLHVGPVGADGYHPLASLMVFADVGDRLTVQRDKDLTLAIDGPFSGGLSSGADNLVIRAAEALRRRVNRSDLGARITLTKALPMAAGLGGGSSDAGAALRLLRELWTLNLADVALEAVAAELGADGAACLWGRPVIAQGRGERLSSPPPWPDLPAVLVNPGVPSPTGAVYRAFDEAGAPGLADRPAMPSISAPAQAADWLRERRNDLEGPAVSLEPRIGEALAILAEAPEALFVRMSGSGATCFALCETLPAAAALQSRLAASQPRWWVRACRLGGPWA